MLTERPAGPSCFQANTRHHPLATNLTSKMLCEPECQSDLKVFVIFIFPFQGNDHVSWQNIQVFALPQVTAPEPIREVIYYMVYAPHCLSKTEMIPNFKTHLVLNRVYEPLLIIPNVY